MKKSIYFIAEKSGKYVKTGISNDHHTRLSNLQKWNGRYPYQIYEEMIKNKI